MYRLPGTPASLLESAFAAMFPPPQPHAKQVRFTGGVAPLRAALAASGARFYGIDTCRFCVDQKNMLAAAGVPLAGVFVDVRNLRPGSDGVTRTRGGSPVTSMPLWETSDGTVKPGFMTEQELRAFLATTA